MNKEYIVYGVIAVGGAAAGFGGGWLIAKKHFAKIADEEIESVRATYEKLKLRKPSLKEVTEQFEESVNKQVVEAAEAASIAKEAGYTLGEVVDDLTERVDRRQVFRGATFDPDDDPASDDPVVNNEINAFNRYANSSGGSVAVIPQPTEPYLISDEAIGDPEFDHHARINMLYYKLEDPQHEGILADESNQIIDDVDGMIGLDNLQHFGRLSGDPDLLYVRNEKSGVDYTVTLVRDRYEVAVLGVTD